MPPATRQLLTARFVAPLAGRLLTAAGVVFEGSRVIAIGDARSLRKAHPDATEHDYGLSVILPGLVNAHTHLELSDRRPPSPLPPRFVDWIMQLMSGGMPTDDTVRAATAAGVAESLRFGVTCVGDISAMPALSRPMIAASPLGGVSFGEIRAMAQRREFLEPRISAAIDATSVTDRLHVGLSPHAPYSVESTGYARCVAVADERHLPLATHLAETTAEAVFLADHAGEFGELWAFLNAFDTEVPTFAGGPIRFAKHVGLLDRPTLLAHVNHCDDDELALLAGGKASVVYCPRTHGYFGHPPHRWRDMLAAGINVSVGTDSRASSPDLNVVDELRLLRRLAPAVSPAELWAMAGPRAAVAIGLRNGSGTLAIGSPADAVVFEVSSDDPLGELLDEHRMPKRVWANGYSV